MEKEMEIYNTIGIVELIIKTYSFLKENIKEILKLIFIMIIVYALSFIVVVMGGLIISSGQIIKNILACVIIMSLIALIAFYLESIFISILKQMTATWFLTGQKAKLKDSYRKIKSKKFKLFKSNLIKKIILYFFLLIHIIPYIVNFIGVITRNYDYKFENIVLNSFFNPTIVLIGFIFYIPCIYFGLRIAFNLESVIFNDKLSMESIDDSMKVTKNKVLSLVSYYVLIMIFTKFITYGLLLFIEFLFVVPTIILSNLNINETFLITIGAIIFIFLIAIGLVLNSAIYVGETIKFIDICREKNLNTFLQNS